MDKEKIISLENLNQYSEETSGKIKEKIAEHTDNTNVHVTTVDKSKWNNYETKIEQNKTDIQNLQNQDNVLSSRIDNLSTLSEGSTTGDAELIDMRVGADGNTYPNAGTAVRTQVSELKSDLANVENGNGFKYNAIKRYSLNDDIFDDVSIDEYTVNSTKAFSSGGFLQVPLVLNYPFGAIYSVSSAKIEYDVEPISNCLEVNTKIGYGSTILESGFETLTKEKHISKTLTLDSPMDRNSGAIYVWVKVSENICSFVVRNPKLIINDTIEIKTEPISTINFATGTVDKRTVVFDGLAKSSEVANPIKNKTWLVYGDSISDDDFFATNSHYYDTIKNKYNMTVHPYAVGGSGYICNSTVANSVSKWGATNNVIHQIETYGNDVNADYVSIEAGTNDWGFSSAELGQKSDAYSVYLGTLETPTTIYGAIAMAIKKVRENHPYSKLFVMTLLPRFDVTGYQYGKVNQKNITMKQFSDCIKDVCDMFSVPCLDMYSVSQLYSYNGQSDYWYDSLHPSELYQTTVFANIVEEFMKRI